MGLVGSAVVSVWAYGLIRDTSGILLDRTPEQSDLPAEIRRAVESDGNALISDLHLWQLSPGKYAAIVTVVAPDPFNVSYRPMMDRTIACDLAGWGNYTINGSDPWMVLKAGSATRSGTLGRHRL